MAIIIAGALVAGALYFNKGGGGVKDNFVAKNNNDTVETAKENNVKAISSADHIRGNPNAKVKVIEFSDPNVRFARDFTTR